jgi:hypothetical protein
VVIREGQPAAVERHDNGVGEGPELAALLGRAG